MKKHKIKKGDPILRLGDLVEKRDYMVDGYLGSSIVTYHKAANSIFQKWIDNKKLFKIC